MKTCDGKCWGAQQNPHSEPLQVAHGLACPHVILRVPTAIAPGPRGHRGCWLGRTRFPRPQGRKAWAMPCRHTGRRARVSAALSVGRHNAGHRHKHRCCHQPTALSLFAAENTVTGAFSPEKSVQRKCHGLCPPGEGLVDTTGPQGTASSHQGQDRLLLRHKEEEQCWPCHSLPAIWKAKRPGVPSRATRWRRVTGRGRPGPQDASDV